MSHNHISSTEFATICQSQITLLSKSLGAVWSVIYLTEEINEGEQPQLFPFAIYPQTKNQSILELPVVRLPESWQHLQSQSLAQLLPTNFVTANNQTKSSESTWKSNSAKTKQLILPLIHQETFIGLLVTGREDRQWQPAELKQIEEIARTIAIARYLELQYHWTKAELARQKNLRRIEHDRLDDLFHQLRNPLTALRTFGKLLLKRLLPEDPKHQIAQNLLAQSDRFQELLEQFEAESDQTTVNSDMPLLEVSKNTVPQSNFLLPSSETKLHPVDLRLILEPLLDTAWAIANERNIQLKSNIPINIPQIMGDFSALREIFSNLIDNALKYTPSGGRVQLNMISKNSTTTELKMLGVAISDTGYGIPVVDQGRIFERHYRGIQAESDIPGTGLGLAIAQELVNRMQGEIELISPNNLSPDCPGTTFVVWLPVVSRK
jgi:signal transduction histidine kinase